MINNIYANWLKKQFRYAIKKACSTISIIKNRFSYTATKPQLIALPRAAERAREIAIQTGTPLIVCRNGKIIDALAKKDN
jgi:hypothetical protein